VQDVELAIPIGRFVSLLGPSGCGKTTTLRMIAGFEQPTRGDVFIRGARVTEVPPYKRDFAMVFQSFALFPHLTVAENVAFGPRMRRVGRSERERQVREAMEREEREQEHAIMMAITEQFHRRAERASTPGLPLAQIRTDYVRLQEVNNGLVQALAAAATLDLKLVAQSAAEIKKRAERLKANLALPQPEAGDARRALSSGSAQALLRAELVMLDELILKCVRNPLFRSPNLVDARHAARVSRELTEIIELSGQVQRQSEVLRKAAQKAP
jgi:ABC-type lipoprotein export system ATPase subunit